MAGTITFASDISDVARAHADWLVEQGRAQHAGMDGSQPIDRAAAIGYSVAGEVLITLSPIGTMEEEIERCIAYWKSSPHHYAILMDPDVKVMGWAWGTYPAELEFLTIGPGMYDPETGEYSTEDSYLDIPVGERGTLRVYVLMVAA